jgi:hypothetical protein
MILEKKIILKLIEKYEKSKSFLNDSQRKVSIKAKELKGYAFNAEEKSRYHECLRQLETKGFIEIEWVAFEENNLLNRVILKEDALEGIYSYYDYTPKKVRLEKAKKDLSELPHTDLLKDFKEDVYSALEKGKFHKYWPEEATKRHDLITVFTALESIDEMTERLFSLKYFSDSKYFEKKVKSKLLSIMKAYGHYELEDDEILESYGITKNPNEILLCGDLEICLEEWVDLSPFVYGTSINQTTIHNLKDIKIHAKSIMTIENKAVYYEYIKHKSIDELVIYLGGFFGKSTRIFLSIINEHIEDMTVSHWGDIDLGGFRIFDYLNNQLHVNLKSYKMGIEDLLSNEAYAQTFDASYGKKLRQYLEEHGECPFSSVIEYMLGRELRLEQEAFYI